jgi:hypothetical protein
MKPTEILDRESIESSPDWKWRWGNFDVTKNEIDWSTELVPNDEENGKSEHAWVMWEHVLIFTVAQNGTAVHTRAILKWIRHDSTARDRSLVLSMYEWSDGHNIMKICKTRSLILIRPHINSYIIHIHVEIIGPTPLTVPQNQTDRTPRRKMVLSIYEWSDGHHIMKICKTRSLILISPHRNSYIIPIHVEIIKPTHSTLAQNRTDRRPTRKTVLSIYEWSDGHNIMKICKTWSLILISPHNNSYIILIHMEIIGPTGSTLPQNLTGRPARNRSRQEIQTWQSDT